MNMPRKIISEELKQEIINYYCSKPMSKTHVCEKYQLSFPTVKKILADIPNYTKAAMNNPELLENFFETIASEEQAYFLGLLISDGNVFKDNTGRQASISITLELKDKYMLEKFKQILKANTSISHDGRGCGQIAIRSNKMATDLEKFGVVPRKTLLTFLPSLSSELMPHLIRGIIDGDGSIQAREHNNGKFLHNISICGTERLMTEISEYITNILSLQTKPTVYNYSDKSLSDIKIQNIHDMELFGNWLYKDATIYLKRKRDLYIKFIKHYNLNMIIPS